MLLGQHMGNNFTTVIHNSVIIVNLPKYFSNAYDICITYFIFKFFKLLCWVWVHCNIYKRSYNVSNISYLNSPLNKIRIIYHAISN
jgi:hypothetical protein